MANCQYILPPSAADPADKVVSDYLANITGIRVATVVVVMFIGFFFGAAGMAAGETSPDVTQALNDLGWLGVLFTGAPFALFQLALAATILLDNGPRPAFPRWSAYFNIFTSFFMCEACLLHFFKTGPFSQTGVLVFYVPMIVFFAWFVVFSLLTLRAINAEAAAGESLFGGQVPSGTAIAAR